MSYPGVKRRAHGRWLVEMVKGVSRDRQARAPPAAGEPIRGRRGAAQGVGFSPGAGEVRAWQRWEAVRRAGPDEEANARGARCRRAGGAARGEGGMLQGIRWASAGAGGRRMQGAVGGTFSRDSPARGGEEGRCRERAGRGWINEGRACWVGGDVVAALRRGRCLVYPWVRRAEKRGCRRLSPLLLVASGGPGGCRRKRWRRVEEQSTRG